MLVMTNEKRMNGAHTMLNTAFLKEIADRMEGSLYIIPSSIHECILIYKNEEIIGSEEIRDILETVNNKEVSPEDILSYNLYVYDREHACVSII